MLVLHHIGMASGELAQARLCDAQDLACRPQRRRNIVAHADIAPNRKEDPGELFDWARLARAGIGLWPDRERSGPRAVDPLAARKGLARIGCALDGGHLHPGRHRLPAALPAGAERWCARSRDHGLIADVAALLGGLAGRPCWKDTGRLRSGLVQAAGRPLAQRCARGKSGLHGSTVPGNARRGRPQGKCHREHTARLDGSRRLRARVKGCGKSAPRPRQRGTARQTPPGARPRRDDGAPGRRHFRAGRPGRSRETAGNSRPRGMAVTRGKPRVQNPAYKPPAPLAGNGTKIEHGRPGPERTLDATGWPLPGLSTILCPFEKIIPFQLVA